MNRKALGRGLGALLSSDRTIDLGSEPSEVDLDSIVPGPMQPRTHFDEASLEGLAESIRSHGIVQPLIVRRRDGGYELVAGERRWRAAKIAGLARVPVIVKEVPDESLLEIALIENIQREDLNPIEEAHAYRRLADEYHLTQEQIADAVGKDRSSIANYVRLLRLPQEVRGNVASNALSMGHARALLALADEAAQLRVARDVVARSLSVRETEALVKKAASPAPEKPEKTADVHTRAAEDKLKLALGTRVHINRKGKGGRIEIEFGNEEELQRLYELLTER